MSTNEKGGKSALCLYIFCSTPIIISSLSMLLRSLQMQGNRITARLCACRCAIDAADIGLSTALLSQ